MKILFINPNPSSNTNNFQKSFVSRLQGRISILSAPLAFQMLAAVTPKEYNIKMIDETYQNINFKDKYDIVGITAMTPNALRAYEIADNFRKRDITVVIGGSHATVLPEEAKQHADSVVIGEAEETWPQVLDDFKVGKLKPFYKQTKPVDLKKIPPPKRDIVNRSFIAAGVQSSRGCPYKCKFCFYSNTLYGGKFRKRPIENVINEIKQIPQKLIIFHDSSFTIDVNHTKKLFKAMIGLNKKFICLGNVDVLSKDDELLKLSKEAGCIQWHIGFESMSPKVLEKVGKITNKTKDYHLAVKKIHEYGMNAHGFFMFGFDDEPESIFKETMTFVKKSKLDSAEFNILIPYPGTSIYDDLSQEGRIITKDWSKYRFHKNVVFKLKNFTDEELFINVKKMVYEYYSYPGISKRFSNALKRGIWTFHPLLFIIENVFTKSYYLKMYN